MTIGPFELFWSFLTVDESERDVVEVDLDAGGAQSLVEFIVARRLLDDVAVEAALAHRGHEAILDDLGVVVGPGAGYLEREQLIIGGGPHKDQVSIRRDKQ